MVLSDLLYSKLPNILNDINTILVPRGCFGCNAILYRGERLLCTVCRNQLPLTEYNFVKNNPVDRIFYGKIDVKKASSFLFYTKNSIVMNLIHQLKYKNREEIGAFLGDWYGQLLKEENILTDIDYIIPVPLHKNRLKKRGYNQVSLFGKQLAHHLNTTFLDTCLIKTKNNKTQTKKGRLNRWISTQEVFTVAHQELIKNKTILLVDDIITTGATMEACANVLKETKNIYITSMAVVP